MNQEPKTGEHKPETAEDKSLRPFLSMIGRHWKAMALGTGLALLATAAAIGLLSLSGWFLAASALAGLNTATAQVFNFFFPSVGVRVLAITRTAARYGERIVSHDATFRILETLRLWCYEKIEPLMPARLDRYHSGDLLTRIITDIETLDNLYLRVLSPSIVAVLITMSLCLWMQVFNPAMALVTAGGLTLAGAGIPLLARWLARAAAGSLNEHSADLRTVLVDGIYGLAALLSCGAERRFLERLENRHRALIRSQLKMAHVSGVTAALMTLVSGMVMVAALAIGTAAVKSAELTAPHLAMLALAVMAAFDAVAMLPNAYQYLGQTRRAAGRLLGVAQIPPAVTYPPLSERPHGIPDIDFRQVSFGYEETGPPVLADIDLHIPAGCHLAVMGETGAGKSTLLYLLARFEDPSHGEIRIARRSLPGLAEEELRRLVCITGQQAHIFSGTIRDNLLLANPDAGEDELQNALAVVQLQHFVRSLPHGLETWVGEAGRLLSGGQARRLAVARAVLSDAPVWAFDEPTEGLDSETAEAMMKALLAHGNGKTIIVVTHLPEVLQHMDQVVVLQEGRLATRSSHI